VSSFRTLTTEKHHPCDRPASLHDAVVRATAPLTQRYLGGTNSGETTICPRDVTLKRIAFSR
jgi:hypothetical protein